jgi:hypothetical protein
VRSPGGRARRRHALVGSAGWRDLLVRSAFRRDPLVASVAQYWIIHANSPGTTSVPLRLSFRRDLLVRSGRLRWTIHRGSAGMTSMPIPSPPRTRGGRKHSPRVRGDARGAAFRHASEGRARRIRWLEGPACQVRCATLDHPLHFGGDPTGLQGQNLGSSQIVETRKFPAFSHAFVS